MRNNMQEENIFEEVELATASNTDTSVKNVVQVDAPHPLSPEWNDYVMGLFTESELVENNPLVHGLRRVAELLLGQIVFSGPTQVFPVQRDDHHGRATVIFTVEFASGMRYSEVADSWEGNTDDMFCAYAVAIASTRAEARALRKALKIRAVAAEELTKKDTAKIVREMSSTKSSSDGDYNDQGRMSDAQLNFIDVKCKQLNISGAGLLKSLFSVELGKKVSKRIASDVIDKLNDFQRDKNLIPESIIGYQQEWRNV